MYNARLDIEKQQIIIEDRDGNVIAYRALPVQRVPNPGKEALMAEQANCEALARVYDLVADANA